MQSRSQHPPASHWQGTMLGAFFTCKGKAKSFQVSFKSHLGFKCHPKFNWTEVFSFNIITTFSHKFVSYVTRELAGFHHLIQHWKAASWTKFHLYAAVWKYNIVFSCMLLDRTYMSNIRDWLNKGKSVWLMHVYVVIKNADSSSY